MYFAPWWSDWLRPNGLLAVSQLALSSTMPMLELTLRKSVCVRNSWSFVSKTRLWFVECAPPKSENFQRNLKNSTWSRSYSQSSDNCLRTIRIPVVCFVLSLLSLWLATSARRRIEFTPSAPSSTLEKINLGRCVFVSPGILPSLLKLSAETSLTINWSRHSIYS